MFSWREEGGGEEDVSAFFIALCAVYVVQYWKRRGKRHCANMDNVSSPPPLLSDFPKACLKGKPSTEAPFSDYVCSFGSLLLPPAKDGERHEMPKTNVW